MDLCLADVRVRIEAPRQILIVLEATMSHVPRFSPNLAPETTIFVTAQDQTWQISGGGGSTITMLLETPAPRVAGAIVTTAIGFAAAARRFSTLRATVIQKDGRAIALIGDDWESAMTIATHFHGRGWTFVGSDHALLDPVTHEVFCVQKSLYINASAVSELPVRYRRAVEASPWYVTARGIAFYAVDPLVAMPGSVWTTSAQLCGIVVVDGGMGDSPGLESIDDRRLREERFARMNTIFSSIKIATLNIGAYVETCDLIEYWFGAAA